MHLLFQQVHAPVDISTTNDDRTMVLLLKHIINLSMAAEYKPLVKEHWILIYPAKCAPAAATGTQFSGYLNNQ